MTPALAQSSAVADASSRLQAPLAILAATSLAASWIWVAIPVHPAWPAYAFATASLLTACASYALGVRHVPGRLPSYGKDRVMVRGLDDWTVYQYNLFFDQASPAQQSAALDHYKVGDRLFPARAKDRISKRSFTQAATAFISMCSLILLSGALHGWQVLCLYVGFFALLMLCMFWSKRFAGSASSDVTEIGLL